MFEVGDKRSIISSRKGRAKAKQISSRRRHRLHRIDFPMPIKQIDRLEAQNEFLAINVYGWMKNKAVVYRISKKEKSLPRINLMLVESEEIQHYCCVKKLSALLFDSKMNNKTYHCMLCLTRFTTRKVLANHEKYCNGVNGRPTRIEMPEEGKNKITFQNFHTMKLPSVISGVSITLVTSSCLRKNRRR